MVKYLWLPLLFSIILLASCEKKTDKVLILDEGDWMMYHTAIETEHGQFADHSIYSYTMLHIKFEKGGAGKIIKDVKDFEFKWQLKNNELQLSYRGVIPYKLISKSKDKMLWERSYKTSLDYRTYIDTLELTRL